MESRVINKKEGKRKERERQRELDKVMDGQHDLNF
jgi:hypothetical protein